MRKSENDNSEAKKTAIELPSYFGSRMVLQQGVATRILGRYEPNKPARIVLERLPADGRAVLPQDTKFGVVFEDMDRTDQEGYFDFRLPVLASGFDPYRLTITVAEAKLVLSDILIGEVWVAGGGANMAMPLSRSDVASEIDTLANVEHVRVFKVPESGLYDELQTYSFYPLERVKGTWQKSDDPDHIENLSAVGFSFARQLLIELNAPVGLIDIAASGTYLHSWLAREVVEDDTFIKGRVREVKQYRDHANWNQLKPDKETVLRRGGSRPIQMRRPTIAMDQPDQHQFDPKNQPSAMFNHKLAPLTGLSLRGFLWYPGENEVDAPDAYARAFRCLTKQTIEMFTAPQGKPAMLYAQLPPGFYPNHDFKQVAVFNEMLAQVKRSLAVPAGYVTCYDLPLEYEQTDPTVWDIPYLTKAKAVIGQRLCTIALGLVYGLDHPTSAPEPKVMNTIGNKLMLDFENVGTTGQGLKTIGDTGLLKGFTVCGPDRVFVPASARILHGVQIMVWHDEIHHPESLTYAFANFNMDANLVSSEGIPVTSFRMDLAPSLYSKPMHWTDCDRLSQFTWPKKVSSIRRARKEDWPTVYPVWSVSNGRGELALSGEHARWGDQSLLLTYKNADSRPVCFEPELEYASLYPPLDLSMWGQLTLHLFSVDHANKRISLFLEDENQVTFEYPAIELDATYRFQVPTFELGDAQLNLAKIVRLRFTLEDPRGHGRIWIDRVQLSEFDATESAKEIR
ncbi:MAG TPA: hypothetical protein GXZ89_08270 [Fastidiosipila sp.]|jgi:sialate O-acetylesterase|nr:hypothetical protein [Fastidiosipila sp.]